MRASPRARSRCLRPRRRHRWRSRRRGTPLQLGTILNDAPCGVAEASPVLFDDGGTQAVEVGDRQGFLYGLNLQTGRSSPAGATARGSTVGSGQGCANGNPGGGHAGDGRQRDRGPREPARRLDRIGERATATSTSGRGTRRRPSTAATTRTGRTGASCGTRSSPTRPPITAPDGGVQASLPIADGGSLVEAGSLGQMTYALNTRQRRARHGLAAVLRRQRVLHRGRRRPVRHRARTTSSPVVRRPTASPTARTTPTAATCASTTTTAASICSANTNEEVDSSPAVGPILPGGAYGIATGTGSFFGGSDENTVKVFDTKCNQVWSTTLDGITGGSPALADMQGNGQLAVVEGTVQRDVDGSVWALNAGHGRADLAHQRRPRRLRVGDDRGPHR